MYVKQIEIQNILYLHSPQMSENGFSTSCMRHWNLKNLAGETTASKPSPLALSSR